MKPNYDTENWVVCRICLQQPSTLLQSIFHQNDNQDLTLMIFECGGVPIKKFDCYPDKICTKCLKCLKVAYKFRTICQRSHKHLSKLIAPTDVDEEQTLALINKDGIEDLEPKGVIADNIENEVFLDMFVSEDETEKFVQNCETKETEKFDLIENEFIPNTSDKKCVPESQKLSAKSKKRKCKSYYQGMNIINEKSIGIPERNQSTHICDVCGNIYPTKGKLTEHLRIHTDNKPHECEICGHAFAQTQQLTRHMITHTGQRPYKCSYCPAAFGHLSTRNKHHRIHTNERPYVCDVCDKSFTYTNTLKAHKMIHTGEKPHVCDICGKGFTLATKLRDHKLTHLKKREPVAKKKILVQSVKINDNKDSSVKNIKARIYNN